MRPAVSVVLVVVVWVVLDPSLAVLTITSTLVETGGGVVVGAAALLSLLPAAEVCLPLPPPSLLLSLSPPPPWLGEVWDGGGVVEEPAPAVVDGVLEPAEVEPACVGGGVELLSAALGVEEGAFEVGAADVGGAVELGGASAEAED